MINAVRQNHASKVIIPRNLSQNFLSWGGLLLVIYLQFLNILSILLRDKMPSIIHPLLLLDKVIIFSLFLCLLYMRLIRGFLIGTRSSGKRFSFGILPEEALLAIVLGIFLSWTLISTLFNGNSLNVTIFGAFAYIKYFLVFFIFSGVPWNSQFIYKSYHILLKIAVFLSCVSIVQEILAMIFPETIGWWPNVQMEQLGIMVWRSGLFRTPSLLGHPNTIAVFALFFWTIELAMWKKAGRKTQHAILILIVLGAAILFSGSRKAIGAALIAAFMFTPFIRKIFIVSVPIILLVAILSINMLKGPGALMAYDITRAYTYEKSMEIIVDHPLFGVGAGMYGGHTSFRFESPVYERYDFSDHYLTYLEQVGSIEQLWLQALAELGLPGLFFLILLFSLPIFILYNQTSGFANHFVKALRIGLMIMPVQMVFYMLGCTVTNSGIWLVPYFMFVGMLVGKRLRGNLDTGL